MSTLIEIKNIHKTYGHGHNEVHAVQGVDLKIKHGEIIFLMGPSGSGKTTLLSIIGGLLHPSEGEVIYNEKNIWDLNQNLLSRFRIQNVGFVFQDFNLLEDLTALENVALAMNLKGITNSDVETKTTKLLTELGLSVRLDHLPHDLSGGEKQRVAIARALINEPALILADEPTANIDANTGKEVKALFKQMAKESGKSLIIATHDWRISDIADRVIWLEDGIASEKEPQDWPK